MNSLLIFLAVLLFLFSCFYKWYKLRALCFFFLIFELAAVGTGFLPNILLTTLQQDYAETEQPQWDDGNVIILLGAGLSSVDAQVEPSFFSHSRVARTAQLYHACQQYTEHCSVLISGGDPEKKGIAEAEILGESLIDLNVAADDIRYETDSLNTWQNADFSSVLLEDDPDSLPVLVTTGVHMKRSLLYFNHFGIFPVPARSDYIAAHIGMIPVGYNFAAMDVALHELFGIARYHFFEYIGLNPELGTPGEA